MRRAAAAFVVAGSCLALVSCGSNDTSTLPATAPVIATSKPSTAAPPAAASTTTVTTLSPGRPAQTKTKTVTHPAATATTPAATTTTDSGRLTGTVEHQLAVLDTGDTTPTKAAERLYARALDDLQKSCTNQRVQLGSYAVTTVQQARSGTTRPNLLAVLQGVKRAINRSVPPGTPARDCTQIFQAYLQILTTG